jgi:hypothetical protein
MLLWLLRCSTLHLLCLQVLPSVLETPPGRDAYGVIDVYDDRLVLRGRDVCMSATLRLPAALNRGAGCFDGTATTTMVTAGGSGADLVVQLAEEAEGCQEGKGDDAADTAKADGMTITAAVPPRAAVS